MFASWTWTCLLLRHLKWTMSYKCTSKHNVIIILILFVRTTRIILNRIKSRLQSFYIQARFSWPEHAFQYTKHNTFFPSLATAAAAISLRHCRVWRPPPLLTPLSLLPALSFSLNCGGAPPPCTTNLPSLSLSLPPPQRPSPCAAPAAAASLSSWQLTSPEH